MTVTSKGEARRRATEWLHEHYDAAIDVVLLDEATRSEDVGWVFFYQTRRFVESGDFRAAMVGNAPLVVDRDGVVHVTGTGQPIERSLEQLRRGVR